MGHRGWISLAARLYYLVGLAYYVYEWVITLSVGVLVASIPAYIYHAYFFAELLSGIGFITISIGVLSLLAITRRRYRGLNLTLDLISVESTYNVLPNDHYTLHRNIRARARMHATQLYVHKMGWSGQGKMDVVVTNPGYKPELSIDDRASGKVLRILFDRPKRRGEIVELEYYVNMTDEAKTARPYLNAFIVDPVRQQTLAVSLPNGFAGTDYKKCIFASEQAEIPIYEEIVNLTIGQSTIEWPIAKPRVGFVYCLYW